MQRILDEGQLRPTRGQESLSVFGGQMRFDLTQGFPLLTTKKLHLRSIAYELLWMIRGDTNVQYLQQNGVSIWNEWADDAGELGPVYGAQWRHWKRPDGTRVDQLQQLIAGLQQDPFSRRHMLVAWNPGELADMALPPCHVLMQCWVDADGKGLRSQLYQRSADFFLGVPFNIASYALFTHMLAQVCGLEAREFIWSGGDVHLYANQLDAARSQLQRVPGALPELSLSPSVQTIDAFCYEDIAITNYSPQPHIAVPVVV